MPLHHTCDVRERPDLLLACPANAVMVTPQQLCSSWSAKYVQCEACLAQTCMSRILRLGCNPGTCYRQTQCCCIASVQASHLWLCMHTIEHCIQCCHNNRLMLHGDGCAQHNSRIKCWLPHEVLYVKAYSKQAAQQYMWPTRGSLNAERLGYYRHESSVS